MWVKLTSQNKSHQSDLDSVHDIISADMVLFGIVTSLIDYLAINSRKYLNEDDGVFVTN